ncbi:MAG: hypothetical protein KGL01_03955 [Betaproteobacteria bacterium]|nr:hypothetical protein [Betaproteobacteria bacterium]
MTAEFYRFGSVGGVRQIAARQYATFPGRRKHLKLRLARQAVRNFLPASLPCTLVHALSALHFFPSEKLKQQ